MIYKKNIFDSLLIFSFFMASNIPALFGPLWLLPDIVLIETILWTILTVATLWAIRLRRGDKKYLSIMPMFWTILPFVVYSGVSIFWSVKWEVSLGRWIVLIAVVVCGAYLGARYSFRQVLRFLALFGTLVLMLSGFYIFFLPNVGVMNYHIIQGAWKGIFWHKNHMGLIASFVNLLYLAETLIAYQERAKRQVILWGILFFLSLSFIIKSDSAAALMVTIVLYGLIVSGMIWLKYREKLNRSHYAIVILIFILAIVGATIRLEDVFGLFNRSTTLTGRIPMWAYLFDAYFSQRPYFGYGFNAFWYIESHQVAIQEVANYPDPIIIADNGFIDILVNTGYIGFSLFLIFYLDLWRRTIAYGILARDITEILPLAVMVYVLLANVSWSLMFENENFFMLIMVALLVLLSAKCRTMDNNHPYGATQV